MDDYLAMPKQDEIKKLAGKVSTLGMGFMRDTEARNKAVPFVQKTVEFSQQIQNTFEAIPQYFEAQDWNSVYEPLRQSRDYLASIPIGTGALHAAVSGAAMSNSAGTAVMTILSNAVRDPDPNAKVWAIQNVGRFERLQIELTSIDFIRRKLANSLSRLRAAQESSHRLRNFDEVALCIAFFLRLVIVLWRRADFRLLEAKSVTNGGDD
jgi:hypothetical protein